MMYQYNDYELDAAVDYIHNNNPSKFSKTEIRDSIINNIENHYIREDINFVGTMGYQIQFINNFPEIVEVTVWVKPGFKSGGKYVTMDGDGKIVSVEYVE